jgi:ribonucleoside-diphosphate reductase alpha chain
MKDHVLKLLGERYFLSNEKTWDELATRVGGIYKDAIPLIKEMKFVPSSPTLMNGNTGGLRKGGLSSCFVMGIDDSIEGIFDSLKEGAIVTKNAGGVGYDFSKLRSSEEQIKTLDGRNSSGPLPFMDMFNAMLDGIRQGGARKGAGGAWLDITHPSILEFIEAKKDWKTQRLNRFNLSVRIPSWFYYKLENSPNEIMMVKGPTESNFRQLKDSEGNVVTIKQLWDNIVSLAHATAEPGILNSDIMFNQCSVTNYSKEIGCNPCCVAGDTLVMTQYGDMKIEDLVGKTIKIWTYNTNLNRMELEEISKVWVAGENAKVLEIETEDGKTLTLTPEHRVLTDRGYVQASELTENDNILSW